MSALRLSCTAGAADDGKTVEQLLHNRLVLPDGFISHLKYIPEGILRDGEPVRVTERVRQGTVVSVRIDDVGEENHAAPADCGVKIVWEDRYLAVLEKPAGICVHGTPEGTPTVANAAAFFWGNGQPFHPVNRLDRGTSGLLAAAKCRLLHGKLQGQLHSEAFCREYLALADGKTPPVGRIELPIDGKTACTEYETLACGKALSLVRLHLHTGRTHQIRIHLSGIGHPLAGDSVYGGSTHMARPALHSAGLSFYHPITQERLQLTSPLPQDMAVLAERDGISGALDGLEAIGSEVRTPERAESPQT